MRINTKSSRLALCLIALLAAGCSAGVEGWEVKKAITACADNDGLDHLITTFSIKAVCGDGTLYEIRAKIGS